MSFEQVEDVKNTALKLNEIRACSPEDYFYLKGWIHCLLQKEGITEEQPHSGAVHCARVSEGWKGDV